ncbi:SWIM zinc finger family protein [Alicyclobacillus tolerans]|uniref:SWIM zinc finger family protein n=1 Tax=Alicyclobacillus tolerans TaxID=90970 RepID=UPI001F26431E|nr:SWIM zinc finger family protein [Alicyclobacillus tolerans]MCF8565263.1 SWIM zinc finger family protein [Alicyclobacillus tolerans]
MAPKTKRSPARSSFVELNWKPFLGQIDGARLRRGKALSKQGAVGAFVIKDGYVVCPVKSSGFSSGTYQVKFPAVDWWLPYLNSIAIWFSRRPDWLASLIAGEWPEEFLEFMKTAGLRLFPDASSAQQIQSQAVCNCPELESPCRHIIAAIYSAINEMEENPLGSLRFVGVETGVLLDWVHEQTVKELTDPSEENSFANPDGAIRSEGLNDEESSGVQNSASEDSLNGVWPEEQLAFDEEESANDSRWQRIVPEFDERKAAMWKVT